ncbi:MAG: hypothetical protein ACD_36C00162G0004 [uncultured bacterium]|uniref:Uncharacterized protein n=1 Tax=Candidatus Gottesmanbacteria bacterium RIFCSPLOWO2_01_FULL_43_11b TaxID=1798392 RepID=A0A1F6AGV1_9BACT|nr:MAG: hypothetical protein ACD_36C00162G0004 [uncultured bacterium]OGG23915.1 MAG: hypothetical protein A3A79_01805 [Candidatus Gottesmanbacteria bacterium RIFCSPLOWO2_01_FULL_43_11b]
MNQSLEVCKNCLNVSNCPKIFTPERVRNNGKIVPLITNAGHCRHYTCIIGEGFARRAIKENQSTNYSVYIDDGGEEIIQAVAFESTEKKTKAQVLRIVSVETGQIFSLHEGKYYPTGQQVLV